MGGKFSKVVRNFNVERRAYKYFKEAEKKPPRPAPKHDGDKTWALSDPYVHQDESLLVKDEAFAKKLSQLEVKTYDPKHIKQTPGGRPLPVKGPAKQELLYGVTLPEVKQKGKVNLETVFLIMSDFQSNPEKVDADYISRKYKLDKLKVQQLLCHYRLFTVNDFRGEALKNMAWEKRESQDVLLDVLPQAKKQEDLSDVMPTPSPYFSKKGS